MSTLFTRSFAPMQAALVAVLGLSACSSTKKVDDVGSMPSANGDVSLNDLGDGSLPDGGKIGRSHQSAYRKSVRPMVHSVPVKEGAHWLNAYYFITSESETWETLSEKFYNRADRVELLRQWNQGQSLHTGTVIYYNSPFRPEDRDQILSFAEDFGQPLEEHRVVAGESLSKLAGHLWGDVHAWPAIAAINPQIAHPDVIEIGETLFLPPSVDSAAILANLVKSVQNDPTDLALDQLDGAKSLNSTLDDSLPDVGAKSDQAVAGTLVQAQTPPSSGAPMRSSTMIVLAGLILVLFALVYIFWKRSQVEENIDLQYTPYSGEVEQSGTLSKLTGFFKTKIGA